MMQASLGLSLPAIPTPLFFDVSRRIARGIRHLDEFGPPNWRTLINRQRLDISSGAHCMTGQIFGEYKAGCCELGLDYNKNESAAYGFNVRDSRSPHAEIEFEALRRGWLAALSLPANKPFKALKVKRLRIAA